MTAPLRREDKVYVAGHAGLLGSAVCRRLEAAGYTTIVTASRSELELTETAAVTEFFREKQPQCVVLAAGKVGGIVDNQSFPADFIAQNLAIQMNVMGAARENGVRRLLFFGSSCMYPRACPQPMKEEQLLSGKPEPTSLPYAIAKLAGTYMCLSYNMQYPDTRFIPVIPNSAYGPNDNFDPRSGHVLSALIARFHAAKMSGAEEVVLWGSGTPRREFIHADDVADACVFLLQSELGGTELPINVGAGHDISIAELAQLIARVVGYAGRIAQDATKPDGAPRKLLDSTRLRALGWSPKVDLESGVRATYEWFQETGGVKS